MPLALGAYGWQIPDLFQRVKGQFFTQIAPGTVQKSATLDLLRSTSTPACDQLDSLSVVVRVSLSGIV
jgi:hypothetical protein